METWITSGLAVAIAGVCALGTVGVGSQSVQACPSAKMAPKKSDQKQRLAWRSDLKRALTEAKASKKPVLVFFGTTSCGACKKMVDSTFQDPRVRANLKDFVTVYVDMSGTSQDKVAKALGVATVPALVFFDAEGKRVDNVNITAFISATQLLPMFERVKKVG